MGMFLPEQPAQQVSSADLSAGAPSSESTQADIALMQRVLTAAATNPNLMPENFMAYLLDWIQTQRLSIPIGQVFGFSQFVFKVADPVLTGESTSSNTYTDLATVGPSLTALSAGQYAIFYGSQMVPTGGGLAFESISLNGAVPLDANSAATNASNSTAMRIVFASLPDPGNSVVCQYLSFNGTSCGFSNRWLAAIKYAN